MGAGRKTTTHNLREKPQPPWTVNGSVSARNLRKSELAGVIFGCKHNTIKECLFKQLFGLPASHFPYVRNVTPGLTLFLFNYSDRKLHGIFEAAGPGQLNINPYGWTSDGAETTPYAAQVRVRVQHQCLPLVEDQFAPILADNFYEPKLFWFELDRTQTRNLINLFLASPARDNAPHFKNTATWNTMFLPTSDTRDQADDGVSASREERYDVELNKMCSWPDTSTLGTSSITMTQKTWSSLFKTASDSDTTEKHNILASQAMSLTLPQSDRSMVDSGSSGGSPYVDDGQQYESWEDESNSWCEPASMPTKITQPSEASMCSNVKDMCSNTVPTVTYLNDFHDLDSANYFHRADISLADTNVTVNAKNPGSNSLDIQMTVAQLIQEIEVLKVSQSEQNHRISFLEQELMESNMQIQEWRAQSSILESGPSSSRGGHFHEVDLKILHEHPAEDDKSVLMVGGFNGTSWSLAMDSYSVSGDLMKSLSPMTFTRSYASATTLNSELYVFGGGNGNVWYDTVEMYSPSINKWASLPSLNKKKGSMAGASLFGKLFAFGGGNGEDIFSEVEMFDPNIGRWIFIQCMHQKRFCPATTENAGALYIVGGYDGNNYLHSTERLDPREHKWTKMGSMNTRRGCHSVVALNGKLFALGGYDGSSMVSSVEVLDPRFGSWTIAEPMNGSRGYSAAVEIDGKIYIFGGVKEGGEILDTIECYKEDCGWQVTNLKAMGKRCFLSAHVL